MFKKVLVANRGEIAVRVMRTLREMGLGSVAIHSEVDTGALHVKLADESRCLGGAEPRDNYLDIEAVVAGARDTGADAVHPGYGFLSENPQLPQALAAAGIAFIGPPAEVMARVGSKTEARAMMGDAGVPVIPGTEAVGDDETALISAASEIGYPLLIKAAAGGGGKGMRVVESESGLLDGVREARSEAKAAFADDTVFFERFLRRPRHVEVQILADQQGHVIHLFERECSMQRRHQKIIEECPCTALDEELRERMGAAAVKAARAAGYVGAGTVEFLLDEDGSFYFLEINARIQVEHPVTEMVTGVDLVRKQIEIAAGLPLEIEQEKVLRRGHAIECRLYAEDAKANFAPSPGRVLLFRAPLGPGLRLDEGITTGSEVPTYYDPILAKLVVWAEDREQAIERLIRALQSTVILGVETSIEFLIDLVGSEPFRQGATHTGLVAEQLASWKPEAEIDDLALLAAVAHSISRGASREEASPTTRTRAATPWESLGRWDIVGDKAGE